MLKAVSRTLLILSASLTSLAALAGAGHALLVPNGPGWWILGRALVAAYVFVYGILTLRRLRAHDPLGLAAPIFLAGAIGLFLVGVGGLGWTLQIAEITGDTEYWVILIEVALMGQALLTLGFTRLDRRDGPPAP